MSEKSVEQDLRALLDCRDFEKLMEITNQMAIDYTPEDVTPALSKILSFTEAEIANLLLFPHFVEINSRRDFQLNALNNQYGRYGMLTSLLGLTCEQLSADESLLFHKFFILILTRFHSPELLANEKNQLIVRSAINGLASPLHYSSLSEEHLLILQEWLTEPTLADFQDIIILALAKHAFPGRTDTQVQSLLRKTPFKDLAELRDIFQKDPEQRTEEEILRIDTRLVDIPNYFPDTE